MDHYKKKLDEIHAPESLISATLNRIHEEEKQIAQEDGEQKGKDHLSNDKVVAMPQKDVSQIGEQNESSIIRRKKSNRWAGITTVAVAAALFLAVGLGGQNNGRMELIYNTVPETIVRSVADKQMKNSMDAKAYSEYIGFDVSKPVENAQLAKAEIHVGYDGEDVISDEATVYYNVDGEQLMIRYSKSLDVVPGHLASGEVSEVNGQQILAGVSKNGKERVAAFERGGIRYFIMSNSMNQETFEEFLGDFLKNK